MGKRETASEGQGCPRKNMAKVSPKPSISWMLASNHILAAGPWILSWRTVWLATGVISQCWSVISQRFFKFVAPGEMSSRTCLCHCNSFPEDFIIVRGISQPKPQGKEAWLSHSLTLLSASSPELLNSGSCWHTVDNHIQGMSALFWILSGNNPTLTPPVWEGQAGVMAALWLLSSPKISSNARRETQETGHQNLRSPCQMPPMHWRGAQPLS